MSFLIIVDFLNLRIICEVISGFLDLNLVVDDLPFFYTYFLFIYLSFSIF